MKSRHLALLTPLVLLSILFSVLSDASNLGGTGGGGSGSMSMGALDGTTAAATGAVISGSSLYMQSATASVPGLINTTSQVMAGAKRFQDNLYVGTAPSEALPFNVDGTMTLAGGSYFVGNVIGRRTVSASDSDTTYGHLGQSNLTVNSGQSAHGLVSGLMGEAKTPGAGTTDLAAGVRGVVTNNGSGGITDAISLMAGTIANSGGGSITNAHGLYINNQTAGTNNYGIYSNMSSGTGKYFLYGAGGAANYLSGKTNIGTANSDGFALVVDATPVAKSGTEYGSELISRKTLSGAGTNPQISSYGNMIVDANGNTQSGLASGHQGSVITSGSSGTVSKASGVSGIVYNTGAGTVTDASSFRAVPITNSGGGTVTNTYGLYLENNTVGTTNYPIYSEGTKESYFTGGGSLSAGKFFVSNEGNLSKVNNVYYNWPASQGSATTYLKNDGSGNLSWASVASGSGDVVGPSSSVDGEVVTMNGTTGKLIRSESKFKITPATGIVNQTFTGSIADYLHRYDLSTATTWSTIRSLTGAISSTPSTMYMDYIDFSYDLGSTTRAFSGDRFTPSFSGTTSGRVQRDYTYLTASSSGTSWGGNQVGATGVLAYQAIGYNTHSTGGVGGMHAIALGNKALGLRGLGVMQTGTNGNAGGVTGTGSTASTPTLAFGGYFNLDANYDAGTEQEVWPNLSAALVANTGDAATTIPAFVAQNAGGSVFQVRGTGDTVIGAHAGTATHVVNGTIKIGRQTPLSVVTLTDAASVALDASLGNTFRLVAGGDRTIQAPSNPINGQKIIIQHYASGGARTLTLTTGAGGFRFGTDITSLAATSSGKTDYIGAIYNADDSRWDVIAVVTGY